MNRRRFLKSTGVALAGTGVVSGRTRNRPRDIHDAIEFKWWGGGYARDIYDRIDFKESSVIDPSVYVPPGPRAEIHYDELGYGWWSGARVLSNPWKAREIASDIYNSHEVWQEFNYMTNMTRILTTHAGQELTGKNYAALCLWEHATFYREIGDPPTNFDERYGEDWRDKWL